MSSWNNVACEVLGWFILALWSISLYPQVIVNFRRKSVVGLSSDFVVFNLATQILYLVCNVAMFFSPEIKKQYTDEYGHHKMIVAVTSHVAFSIHAVVLTTITLFQTAIYECGDQKVSKRAINILPLAWSAITFSFFIAMLENQWVWFFSIFNDLASSQISDSKKQLREEIDNYIFSLVIVTFDVIFMIQHFVLYAPRDDNEDSNSETPPFADADGTMTENV
ncbi:cystinosin homolog [Prosopis cineraria]|uniref:cystinosin homolog n=1 Tax=Prosopis cineraria TaxID=364024 RepID=UPI00240F8F99|nr:cystinosin homolog [Prosopis cineraria]